MRMKYDKYMDKEMIPLCNLLNKFKGIKTTFCCFGHHILGEFYICFRCSNIKSLKKVIKPFNNFGYFSLTIEPFGPSGNSARSNEISVDIRQNKTWSHDAISETDIKDLCKLLRKELK